MQLFICAVLAACATEGWTWQRHGRCKHVRLSRIQWGRKFKFHASTWVLTRNQPNRANVIEINETDQKNRIEMNGKIILHVELKSATRSCNQVEVAYKFAAFNWNCADALLMHIVRWRLYDNQRADNRLEKTKAVYPYRLIHGFQGRRSQM